ncbi:MAG: ABC transporter ATP-binding protein [Anaerolineales bacterium]|jgi:ABC-2 type transport system ATP-binding protein
MNPPTVLVENLSRDYHTSVGVIKRQKRTIHALKNVSLQVQPGEIYGLVGPNGAGKTTLIKVLTTLLLPTTGRAEVLGFDVAKQPRHIRPLVNFILGGERGLYWRISGQDNLRYFADLYRVKPQVAEKRSQELLKMVGLWERRQERVEGYSKGMKQRLHIAKALINDPQVLFLDEPTIGLDPVAARAVRELISEIRGRGVTIFLTSHYMWEMETLCDRIAVLREGEIVTIDTPANLKRYVNGLEVVELQVLGGLSDVPEKLGQRADVTVVSVSTSGHVQTLRVQTNNSQATLAEIRTTLPEVDLSRLVVRPPNLEDAYVQLVGGEG